MGFLDDVRSQVSDMAEKSVIVSEIRARLPNSGMTAEEIAERERMAAAPWANKLRQPGENLARLSDNARRTLYQTKILNEPIAHTFSRVGWQTKDAIRNNEFLRDLADIGENTMDTLKNISEGAENTANVAKYAIPAAGVAGLIVVIGGVAYIATQRDVKVSQSGVGVK